MTALKADATPWHPTHVEDVLDLAAEVQLSPQTVTGILDRELAAGVRIASKLRRATGYPETLWLQGALPGVADHRAFILPPDGPCFLSSLKAIKLDRGHAGVFWTARIEYHAQNLGLPIPLLAHVVTGRLAIGRGMSNLAARFGRIIGEKWDFEHTWEDRACAENGWLLTGGRYIPENHPLKIRLPADVLARSF